jgi:hypothetical protein
MNVRYKTAAEEKAERLKAQAAEADVYRFEPVLMDLTVERVERGQLVVKIQPYGCPRNGTMGQCYVADLEGRFLQMVCLNSLVLVERKRRRQIK